MQWRTWSSIIRFSFCELPLGAHHCFNIAHDGPRCRKLNTIEISRYIGSCILELCRRKWWFLSFLLGLFLMGCSLVQVNLQAFNLNPSSREDLLNYECFPHVFLNVTMVLSYLRNPSKVFPLSSAEEIFLFFSVHDFKDS
jgi:hypothetical protein